MEEKLKDILANHHYLPTEVADLVGKHPWWCLNGTCGAPDKSPRYTKSEIENRLYTLIDDETVFPIGEDLGLARKLINKLLESLE